MKETVTIVLSRSQALVLFELIARETAGECDGISFVDRAEIHALWALESRLESALEEVLSPEYSRLVEEARRRIRDMPQDALPPRA